MYNKTKRGLDLASSIIGIVIGSILALGGIICLFCFLCLGSAFAIDMEIVGLSDSSMVAVNSILGYFIVALIIVTGAGVILVVFNALNCKKPVMVNGEYPKKFGRNLTILIISGLLLLCLGSSPLMFLALLSAIVFKIVAMCLKPVKESNANDSETGNFQTVDSKLNELKRLKELGVIDDEQYKTAVEKIINDLSK